MTNFCQTCHTPLSTVRDSAGSIYVLCQPGMFKAISVCFSDSAQTTLGHSKIAWRQDCVTQNLTNIIICDSINHTYVNWVVKNICCKKNQEPYKVIEESIYSTSSGQKSHDLRDFYTVSSSLWPYTYYSMVLLILVSMMKLHKGSSGYVVR